MSLIVSCVCLYTSEIERYWNSIFCNLPSNVIVNYKIKSFGMKVQFRDTCLYCFLLYVIGFIFSSCYSFFETPIDKRITIKGLSTFEILHNNYNRHILR